MIDLLCTLHLGWVVRKILVDGECEYKAPSFVHALVRLDSKSEIENVVTVWEVDAHRRSEGQFVEICVAMLFSNHHVERPVLKARSSCPYLAVLVTELQSLSSSLAHRLVPPRPFVAAVSIEQGQPDSIGTWVGYVHHRPYFQHGGLPV
jgi:hypothetical protein